MDELISYPKESMGFHLGCFLFNNSREANPVPAKQDIHRLLIIRQASDKEEMGMYYYLFGNGDTSLRTIFIMAAGCVLFPWYLKYFMSKYYAGKQALRFYDLDHFRMLHLPLTRIKDTFNIR